MLGMFLKKTEINVYLDIVPTYRAGLFELQRAWAEEQNKERKTIYATSHSKIYMKKKVQYKWDKHLHWWVQG